MVGVFSVVVELEVSAGNASIFAPFSLLGEQEVNHGSPVVEVFGDGFGGLAEAGAEGYGRGAGVVWGEVAEVGGEGGEFVEEVRGEDLGEAGKRGADGLVEGLLEAGEDVGVEPCVVELGVGEGDEVAPLVAEGEHVGDEGFALGEVAVAVEEEGAEGVVEGGVAGAEEEESAAGGLAVEGCGVLGGGEAASGAGEDGEGAGDFGGDGVDGAEVEAVGLVEEVPVELVVAVRGRPGPGGGSGGRRR